MLKLAVAVLFASTGSLLANEIASKLTRVDLEQKTIVVTTNAGQEETCKLTDETKVHVSQPVEKAGQEQYADKIEVLDKWIGRPIRIILADGDKETAAKIHIQSGQRVLGEEPDPE